MGLLILFAIVMFILAAGEAVGLLPRLALYIGLVFGWVFGKTAEGAYSIIPSCFRNRPAREMAAVLFVLFNLALAVGAGMGLTVGLFLMTPTFIFLTMVGLVRVSARLLQQHATLV